MEVECTVEEIIVEKDDRGRTVNAKGVRWTCEECGNQSESIGRAAASHRRCAALLADTCPDYTDEDYQERNWYVSRYVERLCTKCSGTGQTVEVIGGRITKGACKKCDGTGHLEQYYTPE